MTENDTARTLSARYHTDGSEILIAQSRNNPRRLTPRECARLMGYPETYKVVVSDTQAYRQFGNSVVVPVIEKIARSVCETLRRPTGESADLVLTAAETPKAISAVLSAKPVRYPKPERRKSTKRKP